MGMRGLVGGQGEECHVHGWEKIQKEPNTHRNKEPHNCSTTFCGDPITFHLGWCPRHFLRGSKAASLRRKPIVLEYEAEDGPREEKKEGVLLLLPSPCQKQEQGSPRRLGPPGRVSEEMRRERRCSARFMWRSIVARVSCTAGS